MFARSDNSEIFSWGGNYCGQLARGYRSKSEEYLRPEKIDFFDEKNIIEINCGERHCLALSYDGRVFGWGDNRYGLVGCGEEKDKIISTPFEIDFREKLKFIHCTRGMSFGVSFDGNSYYWGAIDERNKIYIFTPKLIPLKHVGKVYYYNSRELCIILDNNGKVFEFNPKNEELIELKSQVKFCDLYSEEDYYLLQSEECVYQLKDSKLIKTDYNNFKDFYSNKSEYYKKTIEISKDGYLMEKQIQFNEKEKNLILIDQLILDRKYQSNFEEIEEKGRGGFGTVYEVVKKSNKVHYAIKMIEIQSELDLNEIKIMSELNNEFVVQYIDSWIEGKMFFGKIKRYLFIQMELCSMNLRDFIDYINELFSDRFLTFRYFISCEIFKELIECVNYLHELNPPIIHRSVKPEDILISDGINGRFLKLCDFGLSKFHEKSNHTRMVGTFNYMPPEVMHSTKYNTKSDIYSLALIGIEIFGFKDNIKTIRKYKTHKDFDENLLQYIGINLKQQCNHLVKIISDCLFPKDYHSRPDCKQLLEQINLIYVDKKISLNHEDISNLKSFYSQQISKYNSMIQSTIKKYLETKEIQFYKIVLVLEPTVKVLDKYYENNFKYIKEIGRGGYGEVNMVKKKINNQFFAIKQVEIARDDSDDYLKEIGIMSKLVDSKFVVKYIKSWIEEDYHTDTFNKTIRVKKYLFIQMEICSQNLRKFIDFMKEISDKRFNTFNYFISCELLLELIKCLDYLHSIPEPDGPITHRDLNPNNILISDGNNGGFLKLCDFGLSKVYKNSNLSKGVSTQGYEPPEMLRYPRKYSPKSDIYSLAIIATEIFQFNDSIAEIRTHKKREDFNKYLTKYWNSNFGNKFNKLLDTISDCLIRGAKDYNSRPDCKELLKRSTEFSVDKSFVLQETNIADFESFLEKPEYLLLKKFFQTKISNLI